MLMLVRRNPFHVTPARPRATTNQSEFNIQNNIAAKVLSLACGTMCLDYYNNFKTYSRLMLSVFNSLRLYLCNITI